MFTRFLLPTLAVVSIAVLTACGGNDTDPAADATKVADQAPVATIDLVAKGNKFNQDILVVNADREIKLSLANQDNGTIHNFALYTDKSAKENLFRGEIFEGNKTVDETFRAPAPGIYYFRCDAHPDAMSGTLVAK
jgi:plastocyanin